MEFIDTHCHLHFEGFDANRDQVLAAADQAGVKRLICVGTTLKDSQAALQYASQTKGVYASVGVHPHEAAEFLNSPQAGLKLAGLANDSKVVAIGEIGLDFYKHFTPEVDQEKALRAQLESTINHDLPYIFHVRDAWADFWRIFDEYKGLRGVVHSFSSGTKQLDAALSRGLYIGLNGIMTFTKDEAQLAAARAVPLDKLLLETDAPFLAPAKFRGETCEPKHVVATAEFLAQLRHEPLADLAAATTTNAVELFNLK